MRKAILERLKRRSHLFIKNFGRSNTHEREQVDRVSWANAERIESKNRCCRHQEGEEELRSPSVGWVEHARMGNQADK